MPRVSPSRMIASTLPQPQEPCIATSCMAAGSVWQFQSGEDLLDMTPYKRGIRSLLAAPVLFMDHVLVGSCDGWLNVLERATGACTERAFFGAPISASPCLTPDGFCIGTYGGSMFSYRAKR